MAIKLFDAKTRSATATSFAVGNGPSQTDLLINILLELRVMNEYLSGHADASAPVDETRTEILLDLI